MSVREQLVKSISLILRQSKSTLQVLLADENGLSIAKVSRNTEVELDPIAINSVSAATYNFSEEIWKDLGILHQRIAFSFFEKFCLITIRINPVILTIVHDFNSAWPLNAEAIGNILYQLKLDIDEMFNSDEQEVEDSQVFVTALRNILFLFNMGSEIPFTNYLPDDGTSSPEIHDRLSHILDSIQNPVFSRYSIVNQNGLLLDGRDLEPDLYSSISSFSASTIVAFQKLREEAENLNAGPLLSFICISGPDPEQLYGTLACPSGILEFRDENSERSLKSELAFVALFPLTYGMIPILCETRNVVDAIMTMLGPEPVTSAFLDSIANLIAVKYE